MLPRRISPGDLDLLAVTDVRIGHRGDVYRR
ncbi:hypothetical protein BH20ACT18_BH20ACT18_00400 [soil metagenome]